MNLYFTKILIIIAQNKNKAHVAMATLRLPNHNTQFQVKVEEKDLQILPNFLVWLQRNV